MGISNSRTSRTRYKERNEITSGPLGQGHAFAAGAAIAEKFLEARLGKEVMQHKIYAYISDGGIQEEISQGVGRYCRQFRFK